MLFRGNTYTCIYLYIPGIYIYIYISIPPGSDLPPDLTPREPAHTRIWFHVVPCCHPHSVAMILAFRRSCRRPTGHLNPIETRVLEAARSTANGRICFYFSESFHQLSQTYIYSHLDYQFISCRADRLTWKKTLHPSTFLPWKPSPTSMEVNNRLESPIL